LRIEHLLFFIDRRRDTVSRGENLDDLLVNATLLNADGTTTVLERRPLLAVAAFAGEEAASCWMSTPDVVPYNENISHCFLPERGCGVQIK